MREAISIRWSWLACDDNICCEHGSTQFKVINNGRLDEMRQQLAALEDGRRPYIGNAIKELAFKKPCAS